jgi:DNA-binding FadR family transcriptional regulator
MSGHSTALRLIRALNSQTVRYQFRTILIPGRPAASVAEHAAIVEAVVAGRPDDAENAMRNHLFNVAGAVQRGLVQGGIDTVSRGALSSRSP